jgi:altronate dehydratase
MDDISKWAILLSARDNVATVLISVRSETRVPIFLAGTQALYVETVDAIPLGHKVSVQRIPCGGSVVKWGETIGVATRDIRRGEHVHIHNVASQRGRGDRARGEA